MSTLTVCHYHIHSHDAIPLEEFSTGDDDLIAGDVIGVEFHVDLQYTAFPPFRSTTVIASEHLLQLIPIFTRTHLSPYLSDYHLNSLIPLIISYAQSMVQNRPCSPPQFLPLLVDLLVFHPHDQEPVRMVPATDEASASLIKKVKVVKEEGEAKRCTICLEEFQGDEEVSIMPCDHVYHNECIVQWLKTSHMCPLCRYQMPVE